MKEEIKMKTNIMIAVLFAVAMFLIGCSGGFSGGSHLSDSPGSVLGLNAKDGGANQIVTFEVIGKGLEPETSVTRGEAVIMAERAAIMDGYRQFAEKIHGVYVDAFMKAGYGTINQDMIKTNTQSWLRGVEVLEIRRGSHGITEAIMQLRINFSKQGMVWWPSGLASNAASM